MTLSTPLLIAFCVSLIAGMILIVLSLLSAASRTFEFFPPPNKKSWQHRTFMGLFRVFVYLLIGLSIFEFRTPEDPIKIAIGAVFMIAGFGVAFLITIQMGWQNAFGEKTGLQTTGWFRFSRNPIYVSTWIGLIGWSILIPNFKVWVLLFLWALMYLLAPFVEEPWLEKHYGEEYSAYRRTTPRFLRIF